MATRSVPRISLLLVALLLEQSIAARTVNDILSANGCVCPCKPVEVKEYYIPISRTSDWFGAVAYCRSVDMEMAEVLNAAEAEALRETIAEEFDPDTEFYWIGANDLGLQARYNWALTGRPVTYTNWAPGEPNNAREEGDERPMERCVAVGKATLEWNDFLCKQEKKFVCQKFQDD
uniref:C-type lectin domain-containing protein n=1 Tax=Anopheles atroparvus TaxID=41427 RepID=A0AAG5D626_ANOAO